MGKSFSTKPQHTFVEWKHVFLQGLEGSRLRSMCLCLGSWRGKLRPASVAGKSNQVALASPRPSLRDPRPPLRTRTGASAWKACEPGRTTEPPVGPPRSEDGVGVGLEVEWDWHVSNWSPASARLEVTAISPPVPQHAASSPLRNSSPSLFGTVPPDHFHMASKKSSGVAVAHRWPMASIPDRFL